jgi:hypothetical protein
LFHKGLFDVLKVNCHALDNPALHGNLRILRKRTWHFPFFTTINLVAFHPDTGEIPKLLEEIVVGCGDGQIKSGP